MQANYIMVFIRREDQASVCRKVKKLFDCLNLNKKYNTKTGYDKPKKQWGILDTLPLTIELQTASV